MSQLRRRGAPPGTAESSDSQLQQPLLGAEQQYHAVPPPQLQQLPWPLAAVAVAAAALAKALSAAWRCLLGLLHRLLRREAPQLSLLQQERLSSLRERAAVEFDSQNEAHQEVLRALWSAAWPGSPLPDGSLKHERWKEMGWQSDLPTRDIRGGGLISVQALLYLAQQQPDTFAALMGKTAGARSEWEYPFAAAAVGVALMLAQLLELRDCGDLDLPPRSAAARGFLRLLEDDAAFDQVFSLGKPVRVQASLQLLDAVWLEQRATYMQFPGVIKEVRRRLERGLSSRRMRSVADLQHLLLPAS